MQLRSRVLQIVITVSAVLVAGAHLMWPSLSIDGTTALLLAVAVAPWLGRLFKALEFPGGFKIEYAELEKTEADATKAGLISSTKDSRTTQEPNRYLFQQIAGQDPNLALAGLRIEIEKQLIEIAKSHGIETRKAGVGALLNDLSSKGLISNEARWVLADMVGLLNSAVHGAKVDPQAAEWAMRVGPEVLLSLSRQVAGGQGR